LVRPGPARRPGQAYLGGSPDQIAEDVAGLAGSGVDQVFFSDGAARDVEVHVRLLEQVRAAVAARI
jgi:adenosylmethionine-8-amino-7-oxononanoate aminotransferase